METSNQNSIYEDINNWLKTSASVKMITVGILALLLLIPAEMIKSLIKERHRTHNEVKNEISSKWGTHQNIVGPILMVPFNELTTARINDVEKVIVKKRRAYFLPDVLTINGDVKPKTRYRGIYKVVVYNSNLRVDGKFPYPDFCDWGVADSNILWDEAEITMGLTDMRGLSENIHLKWKNQTVVMNPGTDNNEVINNGLSAKVTIGEKEANKNGFAFAFNTSLKGSRELKFAPLGKETKVNLHSDWPHPSFNGAFLPDDPEISDSGFVAGWKVLHVNRNYPQKAIGGINNLRSSYFGVEMIHPVDHYLQSTRSAKYAAMFIGLTFLVFFFVEVLNKQRIHPVQYLLVGLSLCVFYVLLISFSEHIGFNLSYMISSIATISLITAYAKTIFRKLLLTMLVSGMLTILYIFLFITLQLEDYSLLIGSLGLFIILAAVMYASRNMNWYGDEQPLSPQTT